MCICRCDHNAATTTCPIIRYPTTHKSPTVSTLQPEHRYQETLTSREFEYQYETRFEGDINCLCNPALAFGSCGFYISESFCNSDDIGLCYIMASSSPPPTFPATPKRKRDDESSLGSMQFSFDISHLSPPSTQNSTFPDTPQSQSKVAHKFRGLALEGSSGGGVGISPSPMSDDDLEAARKRLRKDEAMYDALDETSQMPRPEVVFESTENGTGSLQRSYPSINRLSESKSRGKKRSGTPPLRLRKGPVHDVTEDGDEDEEDEEMEIVDPVRASLTWHEHEITVYDPEDEDDDGTGINGIGFKPTPALAHARTLKRKQQLAEYRKREETEARAKRNERRRAAAMTAGPSHAESESPRKVRFTMEDDNRNLAVTI